ncbi:armadillo-type protein [Lipomyces arxii]|uniref:armadillo-type protein n=1 Tax=Lipomyces arxii TaxID=56418 RepID=UPI0034CE9F5B
MDFLKSTIASIAAKTNSAFPYSIGERIEYQNDTIWTVYHGTRRTDNTACTIFEFNIVENRTRVPLARNASKKLRTLMFPGVIKVLDTYETENDIYVVTENVTPLDVAIQNRKLMNNESIRWGLHTIALTLRFINVDASSIHGNIRMSSIFITDSGEWKLSGFDLLTSTKDEDPIIYTFGGLVPDSGKYASPEIGKGGWEILRKQPHHLLDSWQYGALIFEIFNGKFTSSDQLQSSMRKQIPPDLFGPFKKLVQTTPRSRASIKQFIDVGRDDSKATPGGGFFRSDMIMLSENIENLSVQSEYEREAFVKEFQRVKDKFPPSYLRLRVLPELVKCFEFGGGGPRILSVMLDISQHMSPEEFQVAVAPTILKMFGVPDRAIRIALLEALPKFIDSMTNKMVNDKLFPDLLTGFVDAAPAVREQTVKAVLVLMPKLSDRNINNDLLRHLAKTQNDEQPGIRTNTTICLGKIAHSLGPNTRSRVLTAAFTRSLRDPFVHGRNAALMALAVTVDIFSADDCASKLLPAICPLLIDKEKIVRTQAHKTVDVYMGKVNAHAASMPDLNSTQPLNSAPASLAGTPKPADGSDGNGPEGSWAGWAINGFTKRMGVDDGVEINHGVPSPSAERVSTDSSLSSTLAANRLPAINLSPASSVTRPSSATSSIGFGSTAVAKSFEPIEDNDDFAWGGFDDDADTTAHTVKPANTEEDDWASFDEPVRSVSVPAKSVATKVTTTTIRNDAATKRPTTSTKTTTVNRTTASATATKSLAPTGKSHSIAAHKNRKKKESMFADTEAADDDGWGDGW